MRRIDRRRQAERVGLVLTGLLAGLMLAFVVSHWLRAYPITGWFYDEFLIAGSWMDHYLGTRVFARSFMWQQIATGVFVGVVAPLVGVYIVHREMALIGETLAHTAFAGVVVGFIVIAATGLGGSPLWVALVVGILGALGVQWLTERSRTYGDVPIAIVLSGSFAVGTLLISWGRDRMSIAIDIEQYLWGNVSTIPPEGARLMAALSLLVVAVVAINYKQFLFITFDEQAARVARLDVDAYNTLLVVITAVVVVGSMQIMGVILVAAMLVVPVAAATQVARSFRETLYLSVIFGELSVVFGFAVAIGQGLPAGSSIVVAAIAIYLATIAVSERSTPALSTRS
ncbi:metal ABC transporter permease [Halobacteriales archaeon QH_7_66_37]|nr:MAG: metal ABC transporter permease [Halobacteriales archaeon QH_7_66_37]